MKAETSGPMTCAVFFVDGTEVYRGPAGDGYQSVTHHAAGTRSRRSLAPDARIVVDDLLL